MSTLLKNQIKQAKQSNNLIWLLFLYITLGMNHVFALLFLPASRSFQTVNDLSENGYTVSYLGHQRMQHNVRFGTLAYSLVLASSIVFIAATVQILNPHEFGTPTYASAIVVNSNAFDNDGSCDIGPGDCTMPEALVAANAGDTITFSSDMTIYPTERMDVMDADVTIDGAGHTVIFDGNNLDQQIFFGAAANITYQNFTIRNTTSTGIRVETGGLVNNLTFENISGFATSFYMNGDASFTNNTFTNVGTAIFDQGAPNIVVTGNTFNGVDAGIRAFSSTGTFSVQNNTFTDCSDVCVYISDFTGAVNIGQSSPNTFSNSTGNGILVSNIANGSVIASNTFTNTGNAYAIGVENQNSSNSLNIAVNQIDTTPEIGIKLNGANGVTVLNNTIESTGREGISVENTTSAVLSGNTITSPTLSAIYLSSSNWINLNTNTVANGSSHAIYVHDSSFNTIYGNTISSFTGRGLFISGSSTEIVFGSSRSVTNAANEISNTNGGIEVASTQVVDFEARKNRFYLPSDSFGNTLYVYSGGATAPTVGPDVKLHNHDTLQGETNTYWDVIDVYLKDNTGWISYAGSATLNGSNWSYDATSLYNTVYVQGVNEPGASIYTGLLQPNQNMTLSSLSASDITDITSSSATVNWTSSLAGTSRIYVASSQAEVEAMAAARANGAGQTGTSNVTNHSIGLVGLPSGSTVYIIVESASTDNQYNFAQSSVASFATTSDSTDGNGDGGDGNGDGDGDEAQAYLLQVLSQITVKHKFGEEVVDGNGTTETSFPKGNLTFTFTDTEALAPAEARLHFVLRDMAKLDEAVVNRRKTVDAQHKASFQVKQALLSTEKTYAVYSGMLYGGQYINDGGLAQRFSFTLLDAPQLLEPTGGVSYLTPSRFVVASKAPSVTVFLDNRQNVNLQHCVATMDDGVGQCSFGSDVAIGLYKLRLVDARGGQTLSNLMISDFAPNNVLTTDTRSANYYKRFVYTGQPTWVGLAPAGSTVELTIPQIDGAMQANVVPKKKGVTTWDFTLNLTDLPLGTTNVKIEIKNKAGVVTSTTTYPVVRVPRAVAPALLAPENDQVFTEAPVLYLLGAADHVAELYNSSGTQLTEKDYIGNTVAFDLGEWFTTPGEYTVTARNRNSMNVPSTDTTFTFTIAEPAVVVPVIPPITDNNTNTNDNTNSNTNTDTTNSNTNTDTTNNTNTVNTNSVDNTNSGTNDNTNGSTVQNANTDTTNTNSTNGGDTDNDGLADSEEGDYGTNPNNPDTDADNMTDGDEVVFGSDPLTADADEDGLTDPQEYTFNTNPLLADTDADGLLDGAEVVGETNPLDPDTDADGLNDDEFKAHGTIALDPDSDNDGLLDGEELARACDPNKADSDNDGVNDLTEAMAGTSCVSQDNLWANLQGIEAVLQSIANNQFVVDGQEQIGTYPGMTRQIVQYDADSLKSTVDGQVKQATVLNIVPGSKTTVSDGNVKVVTKQSEINIQDWFTGNNTGTKDDTYVLVYGQVDLPKEVKEQPAYVVLTFFSTPVVKIAQVDVDGQWTMTVPAELLTAGEHVAYASVDVNGTQTDQVEVAKFVIKQERRLSNTSWLILINVSVAFLAVLVAFYVHIRRRRADANLTSTTL